MRHLLSAFLFVACAASLGSAWAQQASSPIAKVSAQAVAKARDEGTVRVLVTLRSPRTTMDAPQLRMREIEDRADSVLSRLTQGEATLRRRFAVVPALALEVSAAGLEKLAADPSVVRVDVDAPGRGHAVAPDEASVLNQVAVLQDLGLDGSGQKVAVVDSGVDADHPDLAANLLAQQCFCSGIQGSQGCCPNGLDTQSGLSSAFDDNGHGTNVSGIIVGAGGIAPRGAVPAAQLVAVKVLDENGSFCCSSDVVAAMDWLIVNHPDVDAVNLSLGTSALFPGDCDNSTSFTSAMAVAVDALTGLGAVVTASTGNQGNTTMTSAPACVANSVGVGATWDFSGGPITFLGCTESSTAAKQPTCFTNRSGTTDLYAAGAFVTATGNDGGQSSYGGTSQAAPMVAACAVALKQAAPDSTVADRIEAMRVAPTTVEHSARHYPFLDCADAVSLFAGTENVFSDFDGDARSDLVWRHATRGSNLLWHSGDPASGEAIAGVRDTAWTVAGSGDFDGDGLSDLLWRHAQREDVILWESGDPAGARIAGRQPHRSGDVVAGIGDFDGDGRDDVLWLDDAARAEIWPGAEGDNAMLDLGWHADAGWRVVGVGDFDGDGTDDIVWRHAVDGTNELWPSADFDSLRPLPRVADPGWQVAATGDFDGEGSDDLFWRHAVSGVNVVWPAANAAMARPVASVPRTEWQVVASGDYDGDGEDDLFWRNATTGANLVWPSADAGSAFRRAGVADLDWQVVGGTR